MSLRPIYGHDALQDRLAGALAASRFPQASLFVGPPGSGKQRLALWLAQGLVCSQGPGVPCGECPSCTQALNLSHPDIHWFVPIPRPKAGDPDKQVEQAAELLGQVMAERRSEPLYGRPDGMASHALASVRRLQRVVSLTPFQARCKVVILGDAERLIVQEASQEAANALLKVLEEPPSDTVVMLTAAEPQALLPTIRSRLVPIRVGRVGDESVRAFLSAELEPPLTGQALKRRVLLAEGLIGRALWGEQEGEDPDRRAAELLQAVESGAVKWVPRALKQMSYAARGDFTILLDALAVTLRDRLVEGAQAGRDVQPVLAALKRVEETRAEAQGNVNPQLAMAVLADDIGALL
jgi:DNA polymerase-3 subunit delta'